MFKSVELSFLVAYQMLLANAKMRPGFPAIVEVRCSLCWYYGGYSRITMILRDFIEATKYNFFKITVNRCDSGIPTMIPNTHVVINHSH
jgi:hypothetical protein